MRASSSENSVVRRESILFCALLLISWTAEARVRYLKPGGNDANDGVSIGTAWRTIGKANSALVAGDTVYIMEGTYNEKIEPANAGSAGNEIAYIGYPGDRVSIRRTSVPSDDAQVYLGRPYIRLENLDILPSNYDTYRVQQWVTARYIVIVDGANCTLNHVRIPGGFRADGFATITDNLLRGINVGGAACEHRALLHPGNRYRHRGVG